MPLSFAFCCIQTVQQQVQVDDQLAELQLRLNSVQQLVNALNDGSHATKVTLSFVWKHRPTGTIHILHWAKPTTPCWNPREQASMWTTVALWHVSSRCSFKGLDEKPDAQNVPLSNPGPSRYFIAVDIYDVLQVFTNMHRSVAVHFWASSEWTNFLLPKWRQKISRQDLSYCVHVKVFDHVCISACGQIVSWHSKIEEVRLENLRLQRAVDRLTEGVRMLVLVLSLAGSKHKTCLFSLRSVPVTHIVPMTR